MKYSIFCCFFVPGRRWEILRGLRGSLQRMISVSSLQRLLADESSLIIHSWFIFKPKKHLLLLFKSLQTKEKSNSLHGVGNTFNKGYKSEEESALETHARSSKQWGLWQETIVTVLFHIHYLVSSAIKIWLWIDCMRLVNAPGDVDNWNKALKGPNNWS